MDPDPREAQKHMDPTDSDPDPQHSSRLILSSIFLVYCHLHWLLDWCLNLWFRHPCVCSWLQVPEESCLAACWKPCRGKYVLPIFSRYFVILKVDSNEKWGGWESRHLLSFSLALGLWRSRIIWNLNLYFPWKTPYFRFRVIQLN